MGSSLVLSRAVFGLAFLAIVRAGPVGNFQLETLDDVNTASSDVVPDNIDDGEGVLDELVTLVDLNTASPDVLPDNVDDGEGVLDELVTLGDLNMASPDVLPDYVDDGEDILKELETLSELNLISPYLVRDTVADVEDVLDELETDTWLGSRGVVFEVDSWRVLVANNDAKPEPREIDDDDLQLSVDGI